MFARHQSTIGRNFHFCVSRFRFSKSAFFNGCININHMVRQHCFSLQMIMIGVIVWLSFYENCILRDRPSTDSSSNVLTRTEIDFIVRYLATP